MGWPEKGPVFCASGVAAKGPGENKEIKRRQENEMEELIEMGRNQANDILDKTGPKIEKCSFDDVTDNIDDTYDYSYEDVTDKDKDTFEDIK